MVVKQGGGAGASSSSSWAVFSIRKGRNGSVWVRAGWAELHRDGSMSLHLDVLPLDGQLHVRESFERHAPP